MTLNLIALDLLIQRMHENYYVQYYAKSEDNFKMAANFKWTTPVISNPCSNINKTKFTYLVFCYTSLSFNYLLQTFGNSFIKVLNIINGYFSPYVANSSFQQLTWAQGLGASEKKKIKKILYNTTRGRTHLLPFF